MFYNASIINIAAFGVHRDGIFQQPPNNQQSEARTTYQTRNAHYLINTLNQYKECVIF
jgi:hypothetical protein